MIWNVRQVQLISSRIVLQSLKLFSLSCYHLKRLIFIKRSLRPLDDCFLKPLVRPLETSKKVVRKIKANPFERFCRSLDFFAYPFKPLANPLKALEKPLTSRSLAVSFYPLNGKPLVYVFLEKVTYIPLASNYGQRLRTIENNIEQTVRVGNTGKHPSSPPPLGHSVQVQDTIIGLKDLSALWQWKTRSVSKNRKDKAMEFTGRPITAVTISWNISRTANLAESQRRINRDNNNSKMHSQ